MKITRAEIGRFLSAKRIAVIGVSRKPQAFSRLLFQELLKQGYDAIPVNPVAEEIDGKACFKTIKDITPAPERAVIVLAKDKAEQAVLDCAAAGVRDIWLNRLSARDVGAILQAEQKGLNLITGLCLFMFLPNAGFIHRFHGGILKLVGAYPKA